MASFDEWANQGWEERVEKEWMSEYFLLYQITGALLYLRGKWSVISIFWTLLCLFVFVVNMMLHVGYVWILKEDNFSAALVIILGSCGVLIAMITFVVWVLSRRPMIKLFTALKTSHKYDCYDSRKAKIWINGEKKFINNLFKVSGCLFLLASCIFPFLAFSITDIVVEIAYNDSSPLGFLGLDKLKTKYVYFTVFLIGDTMVLTQLFSMFVLIVTGYIQVNIELKVLIDSIEQIEERALKRCFAKYQGHKLKSNTLYQDVTFLREYQSCIKENLHHHRLIRKLFTLVDKVQRWPMFFWTFNHAVASAAGALILIKGDSSIASMLIAILLFNITGALGAVCHAAQNLLDLEEELLLSFYRLKWFELPPNIQKTIIVFQEASKKPLAFRAGGIMEINWRFFTHIMNSAYSYANLLYAIEH